MRKLSCLLAVLAVLGTVSTVSAKSRSKRLLHRPQLFSMDQVRIVSVQASYVKRVSFQAPTLAVPEAPPAPAGGTADPVPADKPMPITLFRCVDYDDLDNIAPCAVSKVVSIVDPCYKPCGCNCCCKCSPKCVYVKICVPRCSPCPPEVTVSRNGRKVRYDYGKYAVDIVSKNGKVYVDYDD